MKGYTLTFSVGQGGFTFCVAVVAENLEKAIQIAREELSSKYYDDLILYSKKETEEGIMFYYNIE